MSDIQKESDQEQKSINEVTSVQELTNESIIKDLLQAVVGTVTERLQPVYKV